MIRVSRTWTAFSRKTNPSFTLASQPTKSASSHDQLQRNRAAMKRSRHSSDRQTPSKRQKPAVPAYHLAPQRTDDKGQPIWPAPKAQIEHAQRIILDWYRGGSSV